MEPMPKMSRKEYVAGMRKKMEAMLGQVADAINEAPDGHIVAGSEERVRDLFAELRQQAFEMGLQMRINAAEAAFPPSEGPADPQNLRHKGRQEYSLLSINGRVRLWRIRWHAPQIGSCAVLDSSSTKRATISVGVRDIACRLNGASTNFDKTAANLARAAQIDASGETLRQLIEGEGRKVLAAQRNGTLPITWSARDCSTAAGPTRVYMGSDGVKVPLVSAAEKKSRRTKIKAKRRQRGRKVKPLPRSQ
jgi:hypothetical protein